MKKITVVGAGGQMGQWFAKYFAERGFEVTGYDSENKIAGKNIISSDSLVGSILKADYVVLCTPTRRTPEIIRLIAKEMKRGTYLIEISSEKSKVVSSLSKMPDKINPICIHPMFGPGTKTIKGQNIISVPIKDAKKELTVTKTLFEGANFVTIDAAEHDKKIAVILGLTHLMNLVFANIISKDEKMNLTEKMSGTTFRVQKTLAESIMTESPELIETIIANPEIRRVAEELWKDIGRLLTAVQESKTEEVITYIKECQERLAKHTDVAESYKRMTKMVKAVEK
ncbi:MAG: prephenate dehydrogenase/arogenate dehydrogenase family protein [Nitrosopumilus sp.]|uniref:prephenate dehydrogenase/arogenate dehydrogenase family protein n=1 Tax=Nitrosopumilus sp. b3 TaxID=2109909 RepID=UPI000B2E2082|nr:prephenate dehydrogenase/arogenate dehydrogenase family protein [Nitrosopumilus sp. b3]KAF6246572.1 prephenate dehydrogenase/arogenate dehydrogenase family protein [Nitrosopumilus sp. b3]MBT8173008.1 prephenate dehydrogenase/arogenate dehydrogenase family protein [Nitrosopumilus sp.]NNM02279.1 prephenate dehydrogenase/arogenate dehydrogenase family protein [Nitrosopumilus sp.]